MNLLLDAGNTRLKWGLHEAGAWVEQGALDYDALGRLTGLVARYGLPARVVGANVAGAAVGARIAAALPTDRTVEWNLSVAAQGGVRNAYRDPARLGADRWAALIGARHLHAGAALVVMAGTATTADLLAADGCFLGGVILPGLELMRRALARDTAQLPFAAGHFERLPRTTEDAIHTGCCEAQAGAIERMFARLSDQPDPICLLGGGAADAIGGLLAVPHRRVDYLVLEGLAQIAADRSKISP